MPRGRLLVILLAVLGSAVCAAECSAQDARPPRKVKTAPVAPIEISKRPLPAYPADAWKRGEEAELTLQVTFGVDGKPKKVTVLKSSGKDYFDRSALEAVEKWTFEPAKEDGVAIEETVAIPIRFRFLKPRDFEPDPLEKDASWIDEFFQESPRTARKPQLAQVERKSRALTWKQLASLEGTEGFAGQFVGVSNGRLLLYGGTNFPDKPIWDGGAKRWYRDVYVLDTPDAKWRKVGALDDRRAAGYGVSLTTHHGIVCIGGADADKHYDDAFILNYDGEKLTTRDLPKLPQRCAYLAGASSGGHVYVAGGIEKPDSTEALHKFWTLDLRDPKQWVELPAWEGTGLLLPTLSVRSGNVVLTGGCALSRGDDGKPVRAPYSKATWLYRSDDGWERQSDAPKGLVAAPSPSSEPASSSTRRR